jgi:predicted glycosyl hydrolase (DUF1957 family)
MKLEEKIQKQIKEMQQFVKKQTNYVKDYQTEISKNINLLQDEKQKAQVSAMMNEAMKGNLQNVQAIAKQLQNDLELKNKENAS